jgi:hypothetical protein
VASAVSSPRTRYCLRSVPVSVMYCSSESSSISAQLFRILPVVDNLLFAAGALDLVLVLYVYNCARL